jgi:hypothetical protein
LAITAGTGYYSLAAPSLLLRFSEIFELVNNQLAHERQAHASGLTLACDMAQTMAARKAHRAHVALMCTKRTKYLLAKNPWLAATTSGHQSLASLAGDCTIQARGNSRPRENRSCTTAGNPGMSQDSNC